MRILHVVHELPPYEMAGTAILSYQLAYAQARHHDVYMFSRLEDLDRPDGQVHTEQRDGLTIKFFNRHSLQWTPLDRSYRDPEPERVFRDFVEEIQPDVIHFQHFMGLGLGCVDYALDLPIPTVFSLHDFWTMCPMGQRMCYTDGALCDPIDFGKCGPCVYRGGWDKQKDSEARHLESQRPPQNGIAHRRSLGGYYRRRFDETPGMFARKPRALLKAVGQRIKEVVVAPPTDAPGLPFTTNPFEHRFNVMRDRLNRMDLVVGTSAFIRDQFIEHFQIPREKIVFLANGMDYGTMTTKVKVPSPRIRFGFTGSVIPTKGVEVLVPGFIKAAETHENISLEIYGAPNRWTRDFDAMLKKISAEASCRDRITFHGRFENTDIAKVLQKIDVLVVPSIWFENSPLVLNEAAMSNTPVIASDRGGMKEFVECGGYGRSFKIGCKDSLADVISELAANPDLVKAMGQNPPVIKPIETSAEQFVTIYRKLMAGSFKAPPEAAQIESRGGALPLKV
ncbi:MAG TPA: glycosyltransferase [Planctomycetota bacterium]|nr:glycosyltransferase [Planctomycetota bacterium]